MKNLIKDLPEHQLAKFHLEEHYYTKNEHSQLQIPRIRREIKAENSTVTMGVSQMSSSAINSVVLSHYMKKDRMQLFYQYDL